MTKNDDFGQNRQNRSTSNGCRIAGINNAFSFFSFKTLSYYRLTKKKLHIEGFIWLLSFKKKKSSDHSTWSHKYAGAGWVQTIIFFSSQNRIEILVLII
jgi:hypothetical protein